MAFRMHIASRRWTAGIAATCLGSFFALAQAQQAVQEQAGEQQEAQQQRQQPQPSQEPGQARQQQQQKNVVVRNLSDMQSGAVYGKDGKEIGHINSLAVDAERGCIAYAIVEFDRLGDIGDKKYAVPWNALHKKLDPEETDKVAYSVNMDSERIKQAEGFAADEYPDMADRQWGRQVHSFWNVEPYWQEARADRDQARLEGTPVGPTGGEGMFIRSGELIGHRVVDQSGKEIGELNAVIADAHSGKLVYGIIQFDEAPDLATDYLHPVPFQLLKIARADQAQGEGRIGQRIGEQARDAADRAGERAAQAAGRAGQAGGKLITSEDAFKVMLNTSIDKVKNGPKFPEREWPSMTQQWGEGVYSAYGLKPFWSRSGAGDAGSPSPQ